MRSGPKQQRGGGWIERSWTRETLRLVGRSYCRRRLFEWVVGEDGGGLAGEADGGERRCTSSRGYKSSPA